MHPKKMLKKEQMYIGREDQKNILSYVDFTRLCYVISQFTRLSFGILKEGITFLFHLVQEPVHGEKVFLIVCRNI